MIMPEKIRRLLQNELLISVVLLTAVSALTYLPLTNQLGYYRDDWHVVWAANGRGLMQIFDQHLTDRPFMGATYALTYGVLGSNPLVWQLYAFCLRLVGGLGFLWLMRQLWRNKPVATTAMALLFLIYPGFLHQPNANAYQNHLFALTLGVFSLALTVYARQSKRGIRRSVALLFSAGLGLGCYLIMEWMVGIEAIRLVMLGALAWRESERRAGAVARRVVLWWLPTLIALGAFLVWRLFLFRSARIVTDVGVIGGMYLSNPGEMLLRFVIESSRDFVETVFLAWGVPFYKLVSNAAYIDLVVSLALAAIGVGLLVAYWRSRSDSMSTPIDAAASDELDWRREAVLIGLASALVALQPVVLANRQVSFEDTFDRYTLVAAMGVAMSVVGGLFWLFEKPLLRLVFLAFLTAFSMITHYHNAIYFREFWEQQRWWQLSWRAPDLKDGALLLPLLPPGFRLAEGYETWGPANLIYSPGSPDIRLSGETLNNETLLQLKRGDKFGKYFRRLTFILNFENSLIVSLPGRGACLHVHDNTRAELSENEEPMTYLIAGYSNIHLIDIDLPPKSPPQHIFGSEPERGWCYYYQKASLARQRADWDEVVRLGDEAMQKNLSPLDTSEWMPFYEGYARQQQMDEANRLGGILRANPTLVWSFCSQFDPQEEGVAEDSREAFWIINLCPHLADKGD